MAEDVECYMQVWQCNLILAKDEFVIMAVQGNDPLPKVDTQKLQGFILIMSVEWYSWYRFIAMQQMLI